MCGCLGKLGSIAADIVTPIVYRTTASLSWPFWISTFINALALIIVIFLNIIDRTNEDRRKQIRLYRKCD